MIHNRKFCSPKSHTYLVEHLVAEGVRRSRVEEKENRTAEEEVHRSLVGEKGRRMLVEHHIAKGAALRKLVDRHTAEEEGLRIVQAEELHIEAVVHIAGEEAPRKVVGRKAVGENLISKSSASKNGASWRELTYIPVGEDRRIAERRTD